MHEPEVLLRNAARTKQQRCEKKRRVRVAPLAQSMLDERDRFPAPPLRGEELCSFDESGIERHAFG